MMSVDRWYSVDEQFAIHKAIMHPTADFKAEGWTITHLPSRLAVAKGLDTRGAAVKLIAKLKELTPKWSEFTDQKSMKAVLTARERSAISALITQVQSSFPPFY